MTLSRGHGLEARVEIDADDLRAPADDLPLGGPHSHREKNDGGRRARAPSGPDQPTHVAALPLESSDAPIRAAGNQRRA